ncbi:MAG: restriction endonuclease [Desulfobacterales bacterium]|nr:restriction endonuclease [Desulfobacterales bacterium]
MNYKLEYISEDDFERLVNMICHEILGCGVIEFSKGKDGGRDGKFIGTANKFPSEKEPWRGKFIIQAKHTENPIAACADSDFQNKIQKEEIPKLKKLKTNDELDNYLLFTNRKFSGVKGSELVKKIKNEVGIDQVEIIGKEVINRYLSIFKHIAKKFNLDRYNLAFEFTDADLKDIVIEFTKEIKSDNESLKSAIDSVRESFTYIDKEQKNEKNNLGKEYFDSIIKESSLSHFAKIDEFLQNPINSELSDMYMDSAFELKNLITVKRDEFGAFEEIFIHIYNFVCDRNPKLRNKRFIYVFLHYMYFNCDIGQK